MGRGAGNVILQSLGGQVERYSTLAARARGLKEVLVSGNIKFYIFSKFVKIFTTQDCSLVPDLTKTAKLDNLATLSLEKVHIY